MRANARRERSHAPREDGDAHLVGAHAAVRSAMAEILAIDAHDPRTAIAAHHRADLADAAPRHLWIAAPEDPGRDELIAIEEFERARPALVEMLAHEGGMIGVQEREPRLARDG